MRAGLQYETHCNVQRKIGKEAGRGKNDQCALSGHSTSNIWRLAAVGSTAGTSFSLFLSFCFLFAVFCSLLLFWLFVGLPHLHSIRALSLHFGLLWLCAHTPPVESLFTSLCLVSTTSPVGLRQHSSRPTSSSSLLSSAGAKHGVASRGCHEAEEGPQGHCLLAATRSGSYPPCCSRAARAAPPGPPGPLVMASPTNPQSL